MTDIIPDGCAAGGAAFNVRLFPTTKKNKKKQIGHHARPNMLRSESMNQRPVFGFIICAFCWYRKMTSKTLRSWQYLAGLLRLT